MIITCDIHHQSLGTGNQLHSNKSELDCAYDFFKYCEEMNFRMTFFFSGLAIRDDWNEKLEEITSSKLVEIGGHNWDCFSPEIVHRVCNKLFGSYNGTIDMQIKDCEKTIDIIRQKTGRDITSWRNHMYMHGPHTEKVLRNCGIKVCSDGVMRDSSGFIRKGKLLDLPINVLPDHEHLYHAERTKEWVEKWKSRYNWSDDFGSDSYEIEEWGMFYKRSYFEKYSQGHLPVSIIHPITMYLADNFKTIKKLLKDIVKDETYTVDEARIIYEK